MSTGEYILLSMAVTLFAMTIVNIAGWILTMNERTHNRMLGERQLEIQLEQRQQFLTADVAFKRGFEAGKSSRQ